MIRCLQVVEPSPHTHSGNFPGIFESIFVAFLSIGGSFWVTLGSRAFLRSSLVDYRNSGFASEGTACKQLSEAFTISYNSSKLTELDEGVAT